MVTAGLAAEVTLEADDSHSDSLKSINIVTILFLVMRTFLNFLFTYLSTYLLIIVTLVNEIQSLSSV